MGQTLIVEVLYQLIVFQHAMRLALTNLTLLATLVSLAGCEFLGVDDSSLVNVFVAHAPTPEGDNPPELGQAEFAREFTNDEGWDIVLGEAYVTVSAIQLVQCNGNRQSVDLYWGACAEDFINTDDAVALGVGGVVTEPGPYCEAVVTYGRFTIDPESNHALPGNEDMEDNSVLLRGYAEKDGEIVDFSFITDKEFVAVVDLSEIDGGGPFRVAAQSPLPKDMTIVKPYNHFFDGVDFNDYDDDDVEDAVEDSLENSTRAIVGQDVMKGLEMMP